ncbi:NAD(P)-dependent oxidoreductase [Leucobacter weissii]|uniref:NAD(P)-dependent oxidoreductase n=1 Tax=Leucobacter weissii TaxID=1983706 RepID=A0A939MR55_9MICO|nr:NAD(P)-dependent oxidoreductase [Leucobacter weissii]MBO1901504.1 NAD(P)-dependent oxidoreductase [Leucobacter weissii]
MTTIGFIGLGTMGAAMVARLLEAGLDVAVWNRTASAADPLVEAGATRLGGPADAFERDVTISMLSNDQAVDAVFSEQLLTGASGSLHVNMASVSTELARELEARHAAADVRYLGAPVLGRPHVARAGQLNIVVGGKEADVEAAAPALDALGKKTWHIGESPAAAALVKIGVNYNLIHALLALGESINMVERGGIDGQLFVDILTDAAFTGSAYTGYGKIIAERSYFPAAFDTALGLKDLALTEAAAAEVGAALPSSPTLRGLFEAAVADEKLKDGDWSIIAEVIRRR